MYTYEGNFQFKHRFAAKFLLKCCKEFYYQYTSPEI